MDDSPGVVKAAGIAVRVEEAVPAATLRYFTREGAFADALRAVLGIYLPQTLRASAADEGVILGWRSPTETVCLAGAQRLARLREELAGNPDGCVVDMSGAFSLVRVSGGRIADLLCRLGGSASLPNLGEARRSRMADVAVLALCVREEEVLLVVDRAYGAHLLEWIRQTLRDFA